MRHSTGRHRASADPYAAGPLPGPVCVWCAHPSCRSRRAALLLRRSGRSTEFIGEHWQAASLQRRFPQVLIWFGEHTQSYWAATTGGLREARDADTLLLVIWPYLDPGVTRPRLPIPRQSHFRDRRLTPRPRPRGMSAAA